MVGGGVEASFREVELRCDGIALVLLCRFFASNAVFVLASLCPDRCFALAGRVAGRLAGRLQAQPIPRRFPVGYTDRPPTKSFPTALGRLAPCGGSRRLQA